MGRRDDRVVSAGPPRPKGRGGSLGAGARGFFDSVTLGAGDEIVAGLDTVFGRNSGSKTGWTSGFGKAFAHNLKNQHRLQDIDSRDHGTARFVGQLTGALVPVVPLAGAARGAATAARSIGRASATGAGLGAVTGFNSGRDGFTNRATSAADGAAWGAGLGAAGGAVAEAAPRAMHYFRQFTRSYPQTEALAQTVRALQRDGLTVEQARQAVERFRAMGKPAVLADVGNNVRARAGVAARSPGASQTLARETLDRRLVEQAERLREDIRQTVAPNVAVHAADDALIAAREAEATPLRNAAFAHGQVDDPVINQLARLPMAQGALTRARELAEAERMRLAAQGQSIDHLPDMVPGENLDVRTLDFMRRTLGDAIDGGYRSDASFGQATASELRELRNALTRRLDDVVPDYGRYRQAYAGPSDAREALAEGRTFQRQDPEAIAARVGDLDETGRQMYRVGAARELTDKVNSSKDWVNRANGIASTPQQRLQLQAMGANADELARRAAAERQMAQLNAELAGSQTDIRRLAAADSEQAALPSTLNTTGFVDRQLARLNDFLMGNRNERVNDVIAPILYGDGSLDLNGLMQRLAEAERRGMIGGQRRAMLGSGFGGTAGLLAAPSYSND